MPANPRPALRRGRKNAKQHFSMCVCVRLLLPHLPAVMRCKDRTYPA